MNAVNGHLANGRRKLFFRIPVNQFAAFALAQPVIQKFVRANNGIHVLIGIFVVNRERVSIFGQLHAFGLVEVLVFAAVVFSSFLYLVSNGALDWGPAKRLRPALSDERRTTQSTIARVGPDAGPTGRAA